MSDSDIWSPAVDPVVGGLSPENTEVSQPESRQATAPSEKSLVCVPGQNASPGSRGHRGTSSAYGRQQPHFDRDAPAITYLSPVMHVSSEIKASGYGAESPFFQHRSCNSKKHMQGTGLYPHDTTAEKCINIA